MFNFKKRPSILRRLSLSFLGFGFAVALVFPFYAKFFVEWKPGMFVWFVAGCVVAGLSIGVANYYLVKIILLNKLRRISEVTKAISQKDLTHACSMESHDMIGDIISSFNHMAETLRNIINEIRRESEELNGASNTMNTVLTNTTTEVQSQQTQVEQVATAMNEMAATAQEVARHAEETADAVREADEQGNTGKIVVVESMGAVDMLADMVSQATSVINNLEKESENIGNVLAVINGIAEQTNLLALNAAIEAARAGEQGRGFAVVADEVRTLATRTQQSTEEISTMIDRLQAGSQQAVASMESGSEQAAKGVDLTEKAAEALAIISGSISTIKDMSFQIASAAKEQSAVIEDVNQNIVRINDVSMQSNESMHQVSSASSEVARMAREMSDLVADFKV